MLSQISFKPAIAAALLSSLRSCSMRACRLALVLLAAAASAGSNDFWDDSLREYVLCRLSTPGSPALLRAAMEASNWDLWADCWEGNSCIGMSCGMGKLISFLEGFWGVPAHCKKGLLDLGGVDFSAAGRVFFSLGGWGGCTVGLCPVVSASTSLTFLSSDLGG